MADVVIVGSGVIGLSIAWELSGAGLQVCVLEQGDCAQEASWAGAGMIPPGDLEDEQTHQLAVLSAQRWPELSAALRSESGIDNGYHRCGALLLGDEDSVQRLAAGWNRLHLIAEILDGPRISARIPAIASHIQRGVWLPDQAQVRNPHHLRALQAACLQRGVEIRSQQQVVGWEQQDGRIQAAVTKTGHVSAAEFVVAAGAWSGQLLAPLRLELTIEPVHGQIVLLNSPCPLFTHIIELGKQYLVPRRDGRVLIGATEERIGFQKRNTDEAVANLLAFARQMIPALSGCPVEKVWSGLRPWHGQGRPAIGRAEQYSNLFVAAGHFRAGLSNSSGTALVMRQLILGEPPTIDLSAFRV